MIIHLDGRALTVADGATVAAAIAASGDDILRTVRNEGYLFVPRVTRV